MKKTPSQGSRDFVKTSLLRRISSVLIVLTALLLIVNTILHVHSNTTAIKRYQLAYHATQFMNASAYLTSEVRAYAVTGESLHYDNYWNEVYSLQNRENGVAALKELGITPEEEALIEEMSQLSDELVPHEAEAMTLRTKGDIEGALAIVYGDYYNTSIARIREMRENLREMLDERSEKELRSITTKFNLVNLVTWLLAASVVLIQLVQKKLLYQMAYIDRLTGIPNYFSFRERMRNGIGIAEKAYVIAVDLKSFSIINDVCGITKGDDILRDIANTLQKETHAGELAAHINGDHFVLFLQCRNRAILVERLSAMRTKIMRIANSIDVPYLIPAFGIREVENSFQPERSYGDANFANHTLKQSGENAFYAFFDQSMQSQLLNDRRMEDSFEDAIRNRRFEMWYQPKYAPSTGKPIGAEALVRWRISEGTLILPGHFIPLFENNGMIARLDAYTFETVCAQQRIWIDAGMKPVPISVNLSRVSLFFSDMVERYVAIADQYRIPHDCIELEITASALEKSGNIEEILHQLRTQGFRILVDDFGSGYSSLSTLAKGCFDCIKIDKSIIDGVETSAGSKLVDATIRLAHEFGITVTAEGVETKNQAEILRKLSCDNIQGYYYSRPVPISEFETIMMQ